MADGYDDEMVERTALKTLVRIAEGYDTDPVRLQAAEAMLVHLRAKRLDAACGFPGLTTSKVAEEPSVGRAEPADEELSVKVSVGTVSALGPAVTVEGPRVTPEVVRLALHDIGWTVGDVVGACFDGKFKKAAE